MSAGGPSAEMAAVAQALAQTQQALLGSPVPDQRANWEGFGILFPPANDVAVVPVELAGIRCERVTAPGAVSDRVVLHLHGGGYVIGSLATHRGFAARLSQSTGACVVVADYRLAPEHPFPAAVDDALAVYRLLVEELGGAGELAMSGDSAGGGLALATQLAARHCGLPLASAVVCWSPWVDLRPSALDDVTASESDDPVLTVPWLCAMADHYLAGHKGDDPLVSPVVADLSGLPPLQVMVGTRELLHAQALELARRATDAAVDVRLEEYPGAIHLWMLFVPDAPESVAALESAGSFLRRHLGEPLSAAGR